MIKSAHRIAQVEEYYFSRKLQEVRDLNAAGKNVINLGIGSPDLPPATSVVESLSKTAAAATSHGYQNYRGIPAFRMGISDFYSRIYKVTLDPDKEILPLMGSKEGIMHISMAFVNEGDEVLIPDPGYPTYASASKLAGAVVKTYTLKEEDWSVDVDALSKMDLSKVKIMWVNYPHMPTGKRASLNEFEKLVKLAIENEFLLVNDNPYSLILNDTPLSVLRVDGAMDVALELNSLSKSHNMAGWRVGWAAGSSEHINAVLKVKSNMDSGMFLGIQQAAVEALRQGPAWFDQLNTTYKDRQQSAFEILDLLGCSYSGSQSGLFVWAKAPATVEDVEKWIDEILYGAGVFITPGFIFGPAGKRYIRISLCAEKTVMQEAITRLNAFVKVMPSGSLKTVS